MEGPLMSDDEARKQARLPDRRDGDRRGVLGLGAYGQKPITEADVDREVERQRGR